MDDLREKIIARRAIFFVDACYAASASTPGARRNSESVSEKLSELWEKEFGGKQELYMAFWSTGSKQESFEDADLKHGLFTWYLLEGLRGKADRNGDRTVTAGELHRFVLDSVEERAKSMFKRAQTPRVSDDFDSSIALAIHGATGSIAEVVVASSLPPPPPVKQEPAAEVPPWKRLVSISDEALAPLKFKASYAKGPRSGAERRYKFAVSMSGPSDVINRIRSAEFYFARWKNPFHIPGRRVGNEFVAEYEGPDCYFAVRVTLTAIDGEVTTRKVNMCSLLGSSWPPFGEIMFLP